MPSSVDIALTNLEPGLARRVLEAYDKEGKGEGLDFDQWAALKLGTPLETLNRERLAQEGRHIMTEVASRLCRDIDEAERFVAGYREILGRMARR